MYDIQSNITIGDALNIHTYQIIFLSFNGHAMSV
jgi:hypothetical protein